MKRIDLLFFVPLAVGFAGCGAEVRSSGGKPVGGDDLVLSSLPDLAESASTDMAIGPPNSCGDHDPGCTDQTLGPPKTPFPLSGDPMRDPGEMDNGVDRDPNGYIILGSSHAQFDFIYTANTDDWGIGTVSKIDSKKVKEVARYYSVTCFSNPDGGRGSCDGTKGCCTRDDHYRFSNRSNGQADGPHQAVQLTTNYPSRTAVDFNGDVWVANRAFGGQSSVSKIANDVANCIDRNGAPGIQTSSDVNDDGVIDSDCNRNGVPDDLADVKGKACLNGKQQEFYGFDDDCILMTTNTNVNNSTGRPLALGNGSVDFGPADAWAGSFGDGKFFRIDGVTGKIKAQGAVQGNPYGAVIDQKGILWAPGPGGGFLAWLDTGNPSQNGLARISNPYGSYGISIDRDQNIWTGGYPTPHAYRYTPDRTNGNANLGKGFWTVYNNVGAGTGASGCQGRGIAADSRSPQQYFIWMACHAAPFMVRIDGSVPLPVGADKVVDASMYPSIKVGGGTICGAGVDVQQNVWAVAQNPAVATRIKVDNMGNATPPSLAGAIGSNCPVGAGDFCSTAVAGVDPNLTSYTYSDFTGFGLRNFTLPTGTYSYVMKGCTDGQGQPTDTKFARIVWDAEVPPNTTLSARARSGASPQPNNQDWGNWTGNFTNSPGDLTGVLSPSPAKYIQVEFDLTTNDKKTSPKLKAFSVFYECPNQPQ